MKIESSLNTYVIINYIKSIGIRSDIESNRVLDLFTKCKFVCPEELKSIFISNFKDSEGKEQFKDLWFFSENYVVEIMNFCTQEFPKFDATIIDQNIISVSVDPNNFDFTSAKDNSKLHIEFYTLSLFSCDHVASGSNCETLINIFKQHIQNNLVRGQIPSSLTRLPPII